MMTSTAPLWRPALLACAALLAASCKDKPAAPEQPAAVEPAAAAEAPSPPGDKPAAAGADPTPTATDDVSAPAPDKPNMEKSEELRFAEATAALLCWEHDKKRDATDKDREGLLMPHGFGGKGGRERYDALGLRASRDTDWGARVTVKITAEMKTNCPGAKPPPAPKTAK